MTSDQFLRRINPLVLLPILVVSSLMLSACQPFQSVYLQNYDSKDVVVTLALRDSVLLDQLTTVDEKPRFRAGLPSPGEFSPGDFLRVVVSRRSYSVTIKRRGWRVL